LAVHCVPAPCSPALISVGEHRVELLFREKEPLQRLARLRRKPERLRTTRVRHDPERLEAEGKQMPGGGDGAGADF